MDNGLWADIQAQDTNLPAVVKHLYGAERSRIEAAAAFLRNDRPIALIGGASAQYLCKPAAYYLNQHGRYASDWCASDAVYSMLPALRGSNIIINSRSGETAEIVKLSQALADESIPFVTITNEPGSTVAQLAKHIIWAKTHKDELVSINVVTGMMLATLALSAAVVGEFDTLYPQFETLAGAMHEVVQRASQQSGKIFQLFAGTRPIYLLYRGASSGSAYCGRLVMEEVARQPGIAMGAAEFRQGPNEVIDEHFAAVVFVPEGKQGELNLKLAADIQNSGGRVLLVGQVPGPVTGRPSELIFPIPDLPDALRPVLEVVPVQTLAFELAKAQGYEPGEVRYISKIILTEDGIPNQS
jgi:glucosamine--fructose-6-phosphate aminotransferase (isomerizing)